MEENPYIKIDICLTWTLFTKKFWQYEFAYVNDKMFSVYDNEEIR